MPLRSMTGYGSGSSSGAGLVVECELSSVNSRHRDVRVALPNGMSAFQSRLESLVGDMVARGYINGTISISLRSGSAGAYIDEQRARAYVKQLRGLAKNLRLNEEIEARDIARLPGVAYMRDLPGDIEKAWPAVKRAVRGAMAEVVRMREKEGRVLQKDINARLRRLAAAVSAIERAAPRLAKAHRKRLEKRLNQEGLASPEVQAFAAKELILFADKSNIDEELVRLRSHIEQFESFFKECKPVGKRLDFLCQEMLREIGTIGAKAAGTTTTPHVVSFKAELESVREQVQNVE